MVMVAKPQKIVGPREAALAMVVWGAVALGAVAAMLFVELRSLERRVSSLEHEVEILSKHHVVLELSRSEHAAAIAAHQEYIEAKQQGFATAWHYAAHADDDD